MKSMHHAVCLILQITTDDHHRSP